MTILRRWRLIYLVIVQLSQKYTKALVSGLFLGLTVAYILWRLYPSISQSVLIPIQHIGIIGEYTPNSLPLRIQNKISKGLTIINTDGSVLPGLASSWISTDSGKLFTFTLRSDLLWHNGKSVEAKDINYNIRNVTFTVLSPHSIQASLRNSYSPFPSLLSKPLFLSGLKGFGEYKVGSIRLKGDKVQYIKLVPVDTTKKRPILEYRFYRTESLAILAYKLGEINILEDLSSPYDFATWRATTIEESVNYNRIISLFFNISKQLFQDKNFRHSLAYALPKLKGEAAISPISKTSWAYTDKVKQYTNDYEAAKKLFDPEAISSQAANLTITTFIQYLDLAQQVSDSWKQIGIKTNIRVVNTVPTDYDILLSAQDIPPDPDQYPFWHSTQTQTNITQYSNVKIDKLLEDGRQELDVNKRKSIYADFQRRLVDDAPALFLMYPISYTIKRR